MQYIVTNDSNSYARIREIFKASYEPLMKDKWESTFEKVQKESLMLSMITEGDDIVAFSTHREMICSNWKSPPSYMADTPELFLKYVENRFRMMTVEWLTVEPSRLGKFSRVQPGDLMLGMSAHFLLNSEFNAIIGFSRQDTRVDQMTLRFGTKFWGTVDRLGIPCSVVFLEVPNITSHPISATQKKIEELWATRQNQFSYLERKKAA